MPKKYQLIQEQLTSHNTNAQENNNHDQVDLDQFDVEKHLYYWTIIPSLTANQPAKKLILPIGSIIIQFLGFVKYMILLFVGYDDFWIYWLGDITVDFGNAKDYCDLCFAIWAGSTITSQVCFVNSYLKDDLDWTTIFRLFIQPPPRIFKSNFHKTVFVQIYPKMVKLCKIGWYFLIITTSGMILASLVYLRFGFIFLITIGFIQLLISLSNCYITTVFVGLLSFIFSYVCLEYRLWCQLINQSLANYEKRNNVKMKTARSPVNLRHYHLHFYQFIIREYCFFHNDLLHATKFWNRSISGLFLGCSASSVLVVYLYFFVDMEPSTAIAITIFGLCTFCNGCLINVLAPAKFRHTLQRLSHPMHRLMKLDLSIGMKFGFTVILDDIDGNKGFTCYSMFKYDYIFMLRLLLELSTLMLLLISGKNGSKTYSPSINKLNRS